MKKYFLHNGSEQQGPFDIEELKLKNISRETQIWFESLNEWTEAGKLEELKSLFSSTPPPFKTNISEPPPITKRKETIINSRKEKSKTRKYLLLIIALIVFSGIALFIFNQISNRSNINNQSYEEKVMTVEETEKSQPTTFLTASGNYNENFWGTKLKVHGVITNNATVATYKDAIVKITYYSKTKTELGNKEYTIYETFPPSSTKNFELKIENYKDVNSIGWEVINATPN